MAPRKSDHYVDNARLLAALIEYRKECAAAKKARKDRPEISDYIGECFVKIATHLSYKPNFARYSYREDMIMDGVENCLVYIHNFNPAKSKNPFSYFTQIIFYAFLRRIQREHKQQYVKYKMIERAVINNSLADSHASGDGASGDVDPNYLGYENVQTFVKNFEDRVARKRANNAAKANTVSSLFDEEAEA